MADLRRPPDWQQPADRHTSLIDPVITVRQLSRFGFARKSLTRIDHALVFSTSKGAYETYLPPLRPGRGEVAARRYTAVYEVDMGVHPHRAEIPLPSDNDAFEFIATVDLSWQVIDPAAFVQGGHRDVPALLLGELQLATRSLTRQFPIHDSAGAEAQVLRGLADRPPPGAAVGLKVIWTLQLRRDQQDIEHQRRLQSINHTSTEQIRTEQLGMAYDIELDRRTRQQDAFQVARALEYGRRDQELVLQRQEWQQEQDRVRARHEAELRELDAEKIAFYQRYLEEGGVVAWAMHLASNKQDSHLVLNSMREDQLRLIQAKMELARELLAGDNAEDYELESPKRLALDAMHEIFNQHLPGIPGPQPPSPSPSAGTRLTKADPPEADPPQMNPTEETDSTFPGWRPPPGYGTSPSTPPPQRDGDGREDRTP
ncbi:hypothetical protein [Streptomyces formicae]